MIIGLLSPTTRGSLEREAAAALLRRLPLSLTRRLLPRLTRRYGNTAGPTVTGRLRLGHRLLLDLRSSVQATTYFSGRFDDELIRFVAGFLDRPGATVLDVGANIGFWTVPLAIRARDVGGEVVAFEPVAANRRRLVRNLRLNAVEDTVRVVDTALSDRQDAIRMSLREEFADGASTGNASIVISDGTDEHFAVEHASTVTLDSLAAEVSEGLRAMKVDVEGHEDRVLAGGLRTIRTHRPVIVAEWNPVYYSRRRVDPTAAFEPILVELGYRTLRQVGGAWQVERRFHSDADLDNLLLVPKERTAEVWGRLDAAAPA